VAAQGKLAQQRFPISSRGLTIGRHPDNDIVLSNELTVSRHHAVVAVEQGQYVLYDRDSANGTWVNDERIGRHVLAPGDRIQIWQSQFVFNRIGESIPSPPSHQAPVTQTHTVGEFFDGYYLNEVIGRGGMSEVFKGQDANGQTVAIKILQVSDPYLVDKFVQEGNRIGPLLSGHPNIVHVHKFGQSPDRRLYLVMDYVDAPSLRRVMQRRLSESEITEIIGQTCNALAFAHENKIVHRDIKPENLLLAHDGTVKILDFGIAKLTSSATVTRNKIVGTPEYISPEQARGVEVWPASDVYSLGVVMYEMLAGSVPFQRPRTDNALKAQMEVIRQHLKERPQPIRKRNPVAQVSKHIERVTMRALEKDRHRRFRSAGEMGKALGYRNNQPLSMSMAGPAHGRLTIVQGPRKGHHIPLSDHTKKIGRLELGSSDRAISRVHAEIVLRGGGYWLKDVSRNGTWVDSKRIYGEVPLRTGARIQIGDSVLQLDTN
jgi:serine/threonine protein kinase